MDAFITKTIQFEVYCKFVDTWIFRATMPYDPFKSINGYYSNFWRKVTPMFKGMVNGTKIDVKQKMINKKIDRIIFEWPSGVVLDMPWHATIRDFEIVQKQLEVVLMKFN